MDEFWRLVESITRQKPKPPEAAKKPPTSESD
jgi:hypothetical protein